MNATIDQHEAERLAMQYSKGGNAARLRIARSCAGHSALAALVAVKLQSQQLLEEFVQAMTKSESPLSARVQAMLEERGYAADFYPLSHLASTIESNAKNAASKVRWYKWFAFPLLFLIPLLSAAISLLVDYNFKEVTLVLSGTLTIITLVNSIMKPGERFQAACRISMDIDKLGELLLEDLAKLKPKAGETQVVTIVDNYRSQLATYQEQLVQLFLPVSAVPSPAPTPAVDKEHNDMTLAGPLPIGSAPPSAARTP